MLFCRMTVLIMIGIIINMEKLPGGDVMDFSNFSKSEYYKNYY